MAVTRVEPKAVTKVLLTVERKAESMVENLVAMKVEYLAVQWAEHWAG